MCREKTSLLFPVERIENKCKHIISRHVGTNGLEETRVVKKKRFILFGDMLKTVRFITLFLLLSTNPYLIQITFWLQHKTLLVVLDLNAAKVNT